MMKPALWKILIMNTRPVGQPALIATGKVWNPLGPLFSVQALFLLMVNAISR
jgi:hypothetical protein